MSNKQRIYAKGRIQGQWTPLRWEILDSPAWKQTSFGARALYIALLRRLSHVHYNNGKIFLSTRQAAKELGASQYAVCGWFHELQHYGFIVMTSAGHLGVEGKGRAAHWRITDMGWGTNIEATKDYLRWDGVLFQAARKTESRPEKPVRVNGKTRHTPDQKNPSGPP
jgi:hypothetical protein